MDNPVMKIVVNVLAVTENGSPMQSLRIKGSPSAGE